MNTTGFTARSGGFGEGGVANLGQPANDLAVAPADSLGEQATEPAAVRAKLEPKARRERRVNTSGSLHEPQW